MKNGNFMGIPLGKNTYSGTKPKTSKPKTSIWDKGKKYVDKGFETYDDVKEKALGTPGTSRRRISDAVINKNEKIREGGYKVGGRDSRHERTSSEIPGRVKQTVEMGGDWAAKIPLNRGDRIV